MMQHKAPHREWEPPIRHLGHDNDRIYPEPETLFDSYKGRSKAISDHDMGLDRTFTERDAKLVPLVISPLTSSNTGTTTTSLETLSSVRRI